MNDFNKVINGIEPQNPDVNKGTAVVTYDVKPPLPPPITSTMQNSDSNPAPQPQKTNNGK